MMWQSDRIAATLPGPDWLAPRWLRRRQRRDWERLASSTAASLRLHRTPVPALWFREYMAYDPTVDLVAIECPILAITGTKDLQVNPEDVARIGSAVAGPFTGEAPKDLTDILRSRPGPTEPVELPETAQAAGRRPAAHNDRCLDGGSPPDSAWWCWAFVWARSCRNAITMASVMVDGSACGPRPPTPRARRMSRMCSRALGQRRP